MNQDPFQEYMRDSEPDKRKKGYAWRTGIGLQAVDGLKTSDYLLHTAVRNIEGEITFQEANALLQIARRRRIRFLPELRSFFRKKRSVLHRRNTFQSTENYLREFIRMRDASGTITLPNRSGFLTEQAFFTAAQRN